MLDELLAGNSTLTLRGPAGSVCVAGDLSSPLLLVAGGTGAAQALAIIDDQLSRAPEARNPLDDAADSRPELLPRLNWRD